MRVSSQSFPEMAMVQQKLARAAIDDIPSAVQSTLSAANMTGLFNPGDTVAIAIGSRGISGIETVTDQCLKFFRSHQLLPFIVPAMGSHGGATASGQKRVLEKLGLNKASLNVDIKADMSVDRLGQLSNGTKIFFSRTALSADHIVLINRVKPHTKFQADIESGLCKMLTIGLGKADGAAEYHRQAIHNTFSIIEDAARFVLQQCPVICGIALVEDGYGELAHVEALSPESMVAEEKALLKEATSMMARIPFNDIDILVIDQFGKDFSGIGMDSNITGRHRDIVGDFSMPPYVKRIFVRDLSPGSDGNANGIGLADVTTRRLVDALDLKKTYMNAVTAISPEKAAIPIYVDTDLEAIDICARTIGMVDPSSARLVRISDTKYLEKIQVSKSLKAEVERNPNLTRLNPWQPMAFGKDGNLMPFK